MQKRRKNSQHHHRGKKTKKTAIATGEICIIKGHFFLVVALHNNATSLMQHIFSKIQRGKLINKKKKS